MKKIQKSIILGLLGAGLVIFAGCQNQTDSGSSKANRAVELCDTEAMSDLKNVCDSEEEVVALIDEVIAETNEMIAKMNGNENPVIGNVRAVSTDEGKSAVSQINAFIDEFMKQLEVSISDLFGNVDFDKVSSIELLDVLLKKNIKFTFDKKIEIGQITFSEWVDVISEVAFNFIKNDVSSLAEMVTGNSGISFDTTTIKSADDIRKMLLDSVELNGYEGEDLIKLLDEYIIIKKFCVGADFLVDLNVKDYVSTSDLNKWAGEDDEVKEIVDSIAGLFKKGESEKTESNLTKTNIKIETSSDIAVDVKNINKFLETITKENLNIDLPVKGIAYEGTSDFLIQLTGEDIKSWISYVTSAGQSLSTINEAKIYGSQCVTLPVCTKKGNGGYFAIEITENADKNGMLNICQIAADNYSNLEELDSLMTKYTSEFIKIKISVSDGTKDTFSKTYNFEEFMKTYGKYFETSDVPVVMEDLTK